MIAAGGIGTGEAIFATMALGAEGVQIGTRFALTDESSASDIFKEYCLRLNEGDTKLLLKKLAPTRLVTNSFRDKVEVAEARGASAEELRELLGRGRAKKGIFEGDLEEGELEIGQVAALFRRRQSVDEVMKELLEGYRRASDKVSSFCYKRIIPPQGNTESYGVLLFMILLRETLCYSVVLLVILNSIARI